MTDRKRYDYYAAIVLARALSSRRVKAILRKLVRETCREVLNEYMPAEPDSVQREQAGRIAKELIP